MSTSTDTTNGTSPRHPVSVTHLVMGLVFLGIAGSWALRQLGVITAEGGRWVLPVILILAGAAGLVAAVAKGLSRNKGTAEDRYDDSDEDPFQTD
jgi:cytochrome c oxidase subunit IV